MKLQDLVNRVKDESSIDKKLVRSVITSTLEILRESIESSNDNEIIFSSKFFNLRRQFIPEVASTEDKEAIPARKRGIIILPKK
tara:strand:+ start:88 stop:339 length:252 start_codon:yes stop_codon:yes gene_type:complete